MHTNTTQLNPLLLVLARQRDTLCSVLQSWALANNYSNLITCHSACETLIRLEDIASQEPVVLITRPVMLSQPSFTAALKKHPNLRVVGWLNPIQIPSEQLAVSIPNLPIVMVNSTEQLGDVIRALDLFSAIRSIESPPEVSQDNRINPNNYRLTDDEIEALLGTG